MSDRPEVVCLCGSARFMSRMRELSRELGLAGAIVLSPVDAETAPTADQKAALDALHRHKIDLADRVVVVNPGGYVGDSTHAEIAYAVARGTPVTFSDPR